MHYVEVSVTHDQTNRGYAVNITKWHRENGERRDDEVGSAYRSDNGGVWVGEWGDAIQDERLCAAFDAAVANFLDVTHAYDNQPA